MDETKDEEQLVPPAGGASPRRLFHSRTLALAAVLVAGALLGAAFVGQDARGQDVLPLSDFAVRGAGPSATVDAAVRYVERGSPAKAVAMLRDVVAARPAYVSSDHGAAAYWLGAALQENGQPAEARRVWSDGIDALRDGGAFDVRLADAYLRSLSPQSLPSHRLQAVDVYVDLLGRVGDDAGAEVQSIFRRHVAQIAPMLSDDALRRVIEQERSDDPETWTFRSDAGAVLQQWWRERDPLPSTPENERLEEHLTRYVYAEKHYSCRPRVSDLDDRGIAYLRYGSPRKTTSVNFNDGEFYREVFRFGVNVSPSDFPENALWLYTNIDRDAYYLFTRGSNNCFEISEANDLLPEHLRQYRGKTDRGLNIAYSALMAMRYVYARLALYHPDFSQRYSEIAQYAEWQETQAIRVKATEATGARTGTSAQTAQVGEGTGQTRTVSSDPMFGIDAPHHFVEQMVTQAHSEDAAAARRRKEVMPRQQSTILQDNEPLPVAVRTVRTLRPDGTTAAHVTWGLRTSDLGAAQASADDAAALVSVSGVRYSTSYQSQDAVEKRYLIRSEQMRGGNVLVPPPLSLGSSSDPIHLSLQWTQFDAVLSGPSNNPDVQLRDQQRVTTARVDSLQPLRAEGGVEMSDVEVMTPRSGVDLVVDPQSDAVPYPFGVISPDTPLLLSFEVYHLAFGADDRTHYEVSYEVEQKTRRGWTRLFRGDDTKRTSTTATYEGTSRRTEELIELDLTDLDRDRTQDVRVTVRVTDTVTGRHVERAVDFVLEGE